MNFPLVYTQDQELNRIQQNVQNSFNNVSSAIFFNGNYLKGVNVGTSATVIPHGLGRTPELWVIGDQNTGTTVYRTAWDDNTITLVAGSACQIALWVS